jgi:hypothetical protein
MMEGEAMVVTGAEVESGQDVESGDGKTYSVGWQKRLESG